MNEPAFQGLRFAEELRERPAVGGIDVEAQLRHFAIVTYAVDPQRVRPHVHPKFDLDCFNDCDGAPKVWVSMVPFEDRDFHLAKVPWLRFRFGQTNYRTYVIDRATGRRSVWFFGTTLDSWSVAIPRLLWKLPWHPGRIVFDCQLDHSRSRYTRYAMTTRGDWAPVELELEDSGQEVNALVDIEDLEGGLVVLTHPLAGVFYRRDGELGTYSVWHDRLHPTVGKCVRARIGLFDRLGLVPYAEQQTPHSVLMQPRTDFTIYLPPKQLSPALA